MSTSSVHVITETLTSTNMVPATARCMFRPRSVVARRPQPPFRIGVRSAGQVHTQGRWNRCMWPGSRFRSGDAGSVDTCAPVSYTHLRAHETVLDLVCRLL